jgi:protein-tyrosine phosphatase
MTDASCNDVASLQARSEIAHIAEHVYLTNFFGAKNRAKLRANGITHVLVCARELPCAHASDPSLVYMSLPLADNPGETLPLDDALAFIDAAAATGGRCLAHCAAGGSRSASVVIAWLMRARRIGYDDALQVVRERRWVEPNLGFETQLRAWHPSPTQDAEVAGSSAPLHEDDLPGSAEPPGGPDD